MIRILNCIKTAADMDLVSEAEWASGADLGRCDFSLVPRMTDPQSECAAELTLRLMDQAPEGSVAACALSIGDTLSERPLRTLSALGYDAVFRIDDSGLSADREDPESQKDVFRPDLTAGLIAAFCTGPHLPFGPDAGSGFDLILLGMEGCDEGSRLVPFFLAEHLGLPHLNNVIAFEWEDDHSIRVQRLQDDLRITETVRLPLILSVGDTPGVLLRVPTLRQRSAARDRLPQIIPAEDLLRKPLAGTSEQVLPEAVLTGLQCIDQSRDGIVFEGNAKEAAQRIYDDYLKGAL